VNAAAHDGGFFPADPDPADLPVLGVCGWSGSGKTTLIEGIVPSLRAEGLRVAVAKHDVHDLDVDRRGKDSDRLFRAGADVLLQGRREALRRSHRTEGLLDVLQTLGPSYDLVLVEGWKHSAVPKLWLLSGGEVEAPDGTENVLATLPSGPGRSDAALAFIEGWLPEQWLKAPLLGFLPADGASPSQVEAASATFLRMGLPVIAGGGPREWPGSEACLRLPSSPADRPYAGLLRAMRLAPHASWLVARPDGQLTIEQWRQLLAARRPGVWAVFPADQEGALDAPRAGYYDCRERQALERPSGGPDGAANLPKAVFLGRPS
jgi:molybdopterin-guanine dinucleotide biosynthesis protein MobB